MRDIFEDGKEGEGEVVIGECLEQDEGGARLKGTILQENSEA